MDLQYGFVSVCRSEHECSPEGNVTVRQLESLDAEGRHYRLSKVAMTNLENTLRIMWFLKAHDIALYRLSDNIIPLATHDITSDWLWWEDAEFQEIGHKIGRVGRKNGYRLSFQLPRSCALIGPSAFRATCRYLEYLERLFALLDLDETAKIIVQPGGQGRNDPDAAFKTAQSNIENLSDWARERLVLENGDRTFSLERVVRLGEATGLPVTFDWQHHWLNHDDSLSDDDNVRLVERAFNLWHDRPPKIHVSSPKSEKQPRLHADYVDVEFIQPLGDLLKAVKPGTVDVMVDAKLNDLALFKLRDEWHGDQAAEP